MTIPTFDGFLGAVLTHLAHFPEGVSAGRSSPIHTLIADELGLTPEDRETMLPSGKQLKYQNRIGWACHYLRRAGLASSPKRGVWAPTEAGKQYLAKSNGGILTKVEATELVRRVRAEDLQLRAASAADNHDATDSESDVDVGIPEERIEQAVTELRSAIAEELLDLVLKSPPAFFEELVLDLLHNMGYGATRGDLQRVGRSGDGGIDGIISLDKLGLEKVYVQAKRWQGNVGRPDIQAFIGALAGGRAGKGVFISTSSYTREAREYAESLSNKIVLVDGARLANLMMDYGVGVQHRTILIPRVDGDYFELL